MDQSQFVISLTDVGTTAGGQLHGSAPTGVDGLALKAPCVAVLRLDDRHRQFVVLGKPAIDCLILSRHRIGKTSPDRADCIDHGLRQTVLGDVHGPMQIGHR